MKARVAKAIEKMSLQGNWHNIIGPNGMCNCGSEEGLCGDQLARQLKTRPIPLPDPLPASARTVTRYRQHFWNEKGVLQCDEVVLYAEVAALLTALAEMEQENARLTMQRESLRALLVHPVVNRIYQDAVDAALAATSAWPPKVGRHPK